MKINENQRKSWIFRISQWCLGNLSVIQMYPRKMCAGLVCCFFFAIPAKQQKNSFHFPCLKQATTTCSDRIMKSAYEKVFNEKSYET